MVNAALREEQAAVKRVQDPPPARRREPYALTPPSKGDGHHIVGLQPSLARRRPRSVQQPVRADEPDSLSPGLGQERLR